MWLEKVGSWEWTERLQRASGHLKLHDLQKHARCLQTRQHMSTVDYYCRPVTIEVAHRVVGRAKLWFTDCFTLKMTPLERLSVT
jgi:hypothetical protein